MKLFRGSLWIPGLLLLTALAAGSCSSDKGSTGTTAPPAGKELDSGNIAASGGQYSHRFMTAGTFGYHCIFHSPMTGTIVVSPSATDSVGAISIVSSTVPFPSLPGAIKVGGVVTWTNNSAATHTVTSN